MVLVESHRQSAWLTSSLGIAREPRVLALANASASFEFAGKRGGKPSPSQANITDRLIALGWSEIETVDDHRCLGHSDVRHTLPIHPPPHRQSQHTLPSTSPHAFRVPHRARAALRLCGQGFEPCAAQLHAALRHRPGTARGQLARRRAVRGVPHPGWPDGGARYHQRPGVAAGGPADHRPAIWRARFKPRSQDWM